MPRYFTKENTAALFALAVLAIIAYLPALSQPFIEDDYPNIRLARAYGPVSGWDEMAKDSVQRVRATTFVLSYALERAFGLSPAAFYAVSVLLHIINCWLLYAIGRWRIIGYDVSFWAAAFFAVYEGHQEAVMWLSGASELLMFLFGFLSFLCWLRFLEKEAGRWRQWRWLGLSILCFLLTLMSKESSVIFIPLFALPLLFPRRRWREAPYLLPYAVIGAVYVFSIFMTRSHSFRFQDKSFVWTAPFWITWTKSYGAMLWFWGLTALLALLWWRAREQPLLLALIWMGIGFIPYMFVDYMHRIPSRQTYLASAGLAWLAGAAIVRMKERYRERHPWLVTAVLLLVVFHNVIYLWTFKRAQFRLRAEATEQLLSLARATDGPIFIKCFPLAPLHAEAAIELILNKPAGTLIWNEEEARKLPQVTTFCVQRK
ncbi:MAG: ArnT family glycosyltransferase [Blastocatellia bacterium]